MVGNTKRKMRDDTPRWQPQSSEGAITSLLNQALVDGAAREALVNLTTLITSSRANAAKAARYKEKAIKLNRRLTEKRFQVSLLKGELEKKKEGLGMDQIKQVIIPYENVQQQRQQQQELAAKVRLMSARIAKLEEENFKLRRNSKRERSEL
eukprot:CAMPEP_0171542846 /NCGR_PEP_ID=MMETSP0960-20121227/2595_1 /TAXON_ID=87120 /ORGANISM="Aurantiochytrium limacinum, Strain ATCCMYA-1381" /LENGTH=151 /DNA_ID=CAMNT_0012090435 /DNA_START=47 /DNA_END=502 /DNA_ORIENTATION=+